LLLSSFSDEGAYALASFTALTRLVLGDETEIYYMSPPEFDMRDEGAIQLALDSVKTNLESEDDSSLSEGYDGGYYGGDYDLDSFDNSEEDDTEEDDGEEDDGV
jgi:hypothetical protein